MVSSHKPIVYFDSSGSQNTEEVLRVAKNRAEELGIKNVVIASSSGKTGVKASEVFSGFNLVVVSSATGFREVGVQSMNGANRKIIEDAGGKVLTATHAFAGVERGIKNKFDTSYPTEIIAETLRLFVGSGTKVAVEIVLMAADAGLIPSGSDVITIAGTHGGADTALVTGVTNSTRIFDLAIKEIIAKPRKK